MGYVLLIKVEVVFFRVTIGLLVSMIYMIALSATKPMYCSPLAPYSLLLNAYYFAAKFTVVTQ